MRFTKSQQIERMIYEYLKLEIIHNNNSLPEPLKRIAQNLMFCFPDVAQKVKNQVEQEKIAIAEKSKSAIVHVKR